MRNILVLGAGRSSTSLIKYLLREAKKENWQVRVGDISEELAEMKVEGFDRGEGFFFNVEGEEQRKREIENADIVVSMLPASMHYQIAKDCIALKTPMVTASYISDEMKALHNDALTAGITILNEVGVDPGIDHMSAMKILDHIRAKGGKMEAFESFTGGLVAPESDDNPWNYKFTWNPRNVVLAGAAGAVKFKQEGTYKYIPYHKVFRRTEIIHIENYGYFEGYANRDSLKYREVYGLSDIPTIYRGTLRRKGFCKAWDIFVQLGATDDSYVIENAEEMTYREFINSFLSFNPNDSVELKLRSYMKIDQDETELWDKLVWLGIFSDTKIGLKRATPAQILEHILKQKWTLKPDDKDMIVMWHKFIYELEGKQHELHSSMVHIGKNQHETAMANTVGLPTAIATKMILNKTITQKGVIRPITPNIYEPVLEELKQYGIDFKEREVL